MLALLLVPQLMRSRAGSEALLFVGTTLYFGLIAVALMTAAPLSAWATPVTDVWTPGTASRMTRLLWWTEPREFWQRVGEWFLFFVLAQAAGFYVGWLMPYVQDNPDFVAAGEARWLIRYDNYALHVVTIYLFSCLLSPGLVRGCASWPSRPRREGHGILLPCRPDEASQANRLMGRLTRISTRGLSRLVAILCAPGQPSAGQIRDNRVRPGVIGGCLGW